MAGKPWGYLQGLQGLPQAKSGDLNFNRITSKGYIPAGLVILSGIHAKSLKIDPEMAELALSSH